MTEALKIEGLTKRFSGKNGENFDAVKNVSLTIEAGKCLGLIGESGIGKSTIAKIAGGMLSPTSGSVYLYGQKLPFKGAAAIKARAGTQMIFQNPYSSFSPRMTMLKALSESLIYRQPALTSRQRLAKITAALEEVGLEPERCLGKRRGEMSGGECQRAAIARALLGNPRLLICDEVTSALDVSIQAQVAGLLAELRKKKNLTLLFISHDIALVSCIADSVAIIKAGEIVESGETGAVLRQPRHPYTKKLIDFCR